MGDRESVRVEWEGEASQWPGDDIPAAIRNGVTPPAQLGESGHVNQTAPAMKALCLPTPPASERARVAVATFIWKPSRDIVKDLDEALNRQAP